MPEIQAAFDQLAKPLRNDSALNTFLDTYFGAAGGELRPVPHAQLATDARFLQRLNDTVIREFTEQVVAIWPDLTRAYDGGAATNCSDCPNSFIPVARPFVVPGGRFREPYYWDSYWVLEGLLRTRGAFTGIARNMIENFLDLVERYGFVPNGARVYYLNRSQPPLLALMVRAYITHTNDTALLGRALPLLEREHTFWTSNRSVEVRRGGRAYTLTRYRVDNTQPRPESYREDYEQATNTSYYSPASGIIYPERGPLDAAARARLYSNLASAAESGWDFSSRWLANPADATRDVYFPLRSLATDDVVPVCLNSILYANERAIGDFYVLAANASASANASSSSSDAAAAAQRLWHARAAARSEAMYALMWNDTLTGFFDYNVSSSAQNVFVPADAAATADPAADLRGAPPGHQVHFHVAQLFPFWTGAAPAHLKDNPRAVQAAFARVARFLDTRAGGIPSTNLATSQQWDQPNVWPPLMHVLMQGLLNTPATFGPDDPDLVAVRALALRLAQRYLDSAFCTWYATGGATSATPKLPGLSDADVGIMFEKYSDRATNVAGGGGEYDVVEGFGWTNGVLIWAVDTFGNELARPDCGDVQPAARAKRSRSAVELHPRDASRTKKFGRRAQVPL